MADLLGTLGGDKGFRPLAEHVVARVSEPREDGVIDVEIAAILTDGGRHHRGASKQPAIVFECGHIPIL